MTTQNLEVVDDNSALTQITKGEIDVQIATAKKYPRQLSDVRNRVLTMATIDEETAQSCFFALPRGGKTIAGESVRLAEIAVSSYQNVRAGWRPISVDRVNGSVTCQGVCFDLENNISTSLEKTRKIQKKRNSETYDEDMITLAINACGAIAYRDAVFKVIPKALFKSLHPAIKEAARGKGKLDQKVDRVIERLQELGKENDINPADVEKRALFAVEAKKREDVDLIKLDILIGIGTSIRDGEIRFNDALPDPKTVQEKPGPDPFTGEEKEGENE